MKPSTQESIDKAEGDFNAALTLYRAHNNPNYYTACYHTQQSAEKYLKARLEEAGQPGSSHAPSLRALDNCDSF